MSPLRVLLTTVGTRGDVQPFLALALGLRAAGHTVSLCTCPRFEAWIRSCGVDFLPLDEGLLDLLDSQAGRAIVGDLDSLFRALRSVPGVLAEAGRIQRRMVADTWQAVQAFQPQVIVYHAKQFCAPAFAARLGIPAVLALLGPMTVPTREQPFWGFPRLPMPGVGPLWNRATWQLVNRLVHLGSNHYLADWRRANDPQGLSQGVRPDRLAPGKPITVLHGYSDAVWPRPADWPSSAHVTGYWFLDEVSSPGMPAGALPAQAGPAWRPPPALQAFLERHPAPVYIGFGSMAGTDPASSGRIVLDAVQRTGLPAVLARGWGGLDVSVDLPRVQVIGEAPHDWLFPRMSVIVHHGGAGTSAAALRAGRPSVVCPFGLDQPMWARRLKQLGVALDAVPQRKLQADRLAQAILNTSGNAALQACAGRIAARIAAERGIERAVALIESAVRP